eukprot:TRINITY_DN5776_c0_g1_i1.p2 TRINITY_DN5776_c0_g1~~TRINITY_DN5776_c0_g1_i1.p2  ORF type:complete len:147 (-),score=14.01 TRINITY_DN5776_c0_g1_i1:17-457(-)
MPGERPKNAAVVNSVAFSSNSEFLFAVAQFGRAMLYDFATSQELLRLETPGAVFWCGCFSPSGTLLVGGGGGLWEFGAKTGAQITRLAEGNIWSIVALQKRPWLLVGSLRTLCMTRLDKERSTISLERLPRHVVEELHEARTTAHD